MKKVSLSFLVLASFFIYAAGWRHLQHDDEASAVVPPANLSPLPTETTSLVEATPLPSPSQTTSTTSPAPTHRPTATPTPTPSGKYKNGTYTGPVVDAYYGNVQVKVTVSGGRISDVQFLQYPNDRRTSTEINTQAMPYLRQEAIQAQSAQVDGVSGATSTSYGFEQSLSGALSQAV